MPSLDKRQARKKCGVCTECGIRPARPARTTCQHCTDERVATIKTERFKKYAREKMKENYDYRKANRICVNCGQPLAEEEKAVRCYPCRARNNLVHKHSYFPEDRHGRVPGTAAAIHRAWEERWKEGKK